jgi:hypothetical protein
MAARLSIPVDGGATLSFSFTTDVETGVDSNGAPTYAPQLLIGAVVRLTVQGIKDPILCDVSVDGAVTVTLTPEQTATLPRKSPYVVEATWSTGVVQRLLEGHLIANARPKGA